MRKVSEVFIPQLQGFSQILESIHQLHSEHVTVMHQWQTYLQSECHHLVVQMDAGLNALPVNSKYYESMLTNLSHAMEFQEAVDTLRNVLHDYEADTNKTLGIFTTHWREFASLKAVEYLTDYLREEHNAFTSFQKFYRTSGLGISLELDMLAYNTTELFVGTLVHHFEMNHLSLLPKFEEQLRHATPEFGHLYFQPIYICMHADKEAISKAKECGVWVLQFIGNGQNDFRWYAQ
ncbi:hypothetical protein CLV59_104193 [Chitinophaga dinghuensis]|uniref:Uncharacterized protein n=1 Tax=Chitinophaga dinghuensis TaxID=1539050 RepID=A0A327W7G4_9BACT|nr:hypothetical protein [Chitinophaga dinghuensis]RAJ81968.1 hypothetical protein CLV59_104193 [Chitinophaga dinghuensis]